MGQTLTHGVYLPDEGERNCYSGLAANWQILDGSVGTIAAHTAALSGKAPLVHTHGNITNDGKVGTAANKPLITGTGGVIQAGSFGNQANTFCEGNDSRLSDARTPVAHTHTKSDVTDLLNSNFIPSANNSYNLGSSSYQWNNLYAKNYYYNGTAWGLDKANAWSENNKFSKTVSPSDITGIGSNTMAFSGLRSVIFFNTTGSSNRPSYGTFLYSGYSAGTAPDNYGQLQLLRSTDKKGETNNGLIPDTSFTMWRVAPHYLLMDFMNAVRVTNDGTENSLKPITNNTTNLGTSTNKWKSLNGINPGALSLPDLASDGYIALSDNISANTEYSYTPTVDGWLALYCQTTGFHAENAVGIFTGGGQSNSYRWACSATSAINLPRANAYHGAVMLPVKAGLPYLCWITINSSTTLSAKRLYFYKATGNV